MAAAQRPNRLIVVPVDHVIRDPLPWRFGTLPERTECGRDLADVHQAITYAEFHQAAGEYNETVATFRRAGMKVPASIHRPNICQNCWDKLVHYPPWERVPIRRLWRHLDEFGYYPAGRDAEQMCRELWALAQLAGRHRAEFQALVDGMALGYRRDDP